MKPASKDLNMQRRPNQFELFEALIVRDLMARFGRNHLGFLWTILEPMILCSGVMLMWSLIKEPFIHEIPIVTFVLTGYMPLTLWRHMTNALLRLLRNNANLLYHQPISHIHLIVARMVVEFLSASIALGVIYFIVRSIGIVDPIQDFGLTLSGWLFTGWYFGAIGLLLGVWAEIWDPAEKFIQPLQYLQLPISGVFFMVDWLPAWARELLLLNPAVHCFEMFRAGFLGETFTTYYSVPYLATASLFMSALAGVALFNVRDRIQMS